jgi:hypothetical protein
MEKRAYFILAVFVLSTSYFVYQMHSGMSWDMIVYSLNSQYMFSDGHYFEWERPPLLPAMLFLMSPLGVAGAETLFVILVSAFFFSLILLFSREAKIDTVLFCAVLVNPIVLKYAFFAGTELLTLSLLMAALIGMGKRHSSLFFGFSTLTRYTSIIYLPLFIGRSLKKNATFAAILLLLWLPWMIYNQVNAGHPLYSVASSMLLNVQARDYEPVEYSAVKVFFLVAYGILALLGIRWKLRFWGGYDSSMAFFALLSILSFISVPFREWRYLMNIWLPIAYFASSYLGDKIRRKTLMAALIVALNFSAIPHIGTSYHGPPDFFESLEQIELECQHMSNAWPYLNRVGIHAEPMPHPIVLNESIEVGKRIVYYEGVDDFQILDDFLLFEGKKFKIFGSQKECMPKKDVIVSYIEFRKQWGEEINLCPLIPIRC